MWHAMPNMESLLNNNPVILLWTYQRAMSPLKTFFRFKNRNKSISVPFITTFFEMKRFLYPFIVQKMWLKTSKKLRFRQQESSPLKSSNY